ncbi:MAG: PAS domain S-box protein [Oligoflexia bacterium]|nr:PAS domain S-box protein [Oligoflexia bacterium]MBF0364934.1 PAS domain S-box protein [Oligoflexia bacterium]
MNNKPLLQHLKAIPVNIFKKITVAQLLIFIFVYILLTTFTHYTLKKNIFNQAEKQLSEELLLLSNLIEKNRLTTNLCQTGIFSPAYTTSRITVIDISGKVLCDSVKDAALMENHLHRPEVERALKQKVGISIRYGQTLNLNMLYGAVVIHYPEPNPHPSIILRISTPLYDLDNVIKIFDHIFILLAIPFLLLGPCVLIWNSYKLIRPVKAILLKLFSIQEKTRQLLLPLEKSPPQIFTNSTSTSLKETDLPLVEDLLCATENNLDKLKNLSQIEKNKLSILLNCTPNSIVAIDNNFSIWFANKKFCETFFHNRKWLPSKEHKLFELFRGPHLTALFKESILQGKEQSLQEIQLATTTKEATEKSFFEVTISPIFDIEKATILGALAVFHDISARKKIEQVKLDFISNFSHEVRTPLSSVSGYIQLLKEHPLPYLDKIESNLKKMVRLFDNLLELSSIESKTQIAHEKLSLHALTEESTLSLQTIYKHKNISLAISIDPTLSEIEGDPLLLEQVITNLLDNAYKFSPPHTTITLAWKSEPRFIVLEIADQGVGIPLHAQERIFERFFQVDSSHGKDREGSGLGLAIVKHILQKHHAILKLHSLFGKGTKITIYFNREPKSLGPLS